MDDKQLNIDIGNKMVNLYYFTDGILAVGLNYILHIHQ